MLKSLACHMQKPCGLVGAIAIHMKVQIQVPLSRHQEHPARHNAACCESGHSVHACTLLKLPFKVCGQGFSCVMILIGINGGALVDGWLHIS